MTVMVISILAIVDLKMAVISNFWFGIIDKQCHCWRRYTVHNVSVTTVTPRVVGTARTTRTNVIIVPSIER